uniref:adenylate kinase n=2 Tax=Brassica TaxID=3705 RepID=A0A0D3DUJ1_BRAOL
MLSSPIFHPYELPSSAERELDIGGSGERRVEDRRRVTWLTHRLCRGLNPVRIPSEAVAKIKPAFVLFFDCPEEELERRIMNRNQGREDDNLETIKKRFKVFVESTLPIVSYYESKGKLRKINAAKPSQEVFEEVKYVFASET